VPPAPGRRKLGVPFAGSSHGDDFALGEQRLYARVDQAGFKEATPFAHPRGRDAMTAIGQLIRLKPKPF
jgi:hypothetical protein